MFPRNVPQSGFRGFPVVTGAEGKHRNYERNPDTALCQKDIMVADLIGQNHLPFARKNTGRGTNRTKNRRISSADEPAMTWYPGPRSLYGKVSTIKFTYLHRAEHGNADHQHHGRGIRAVRRKLADVLAEIGDCSELTGTVENVSRDMRKGRMRPARF